MDLSDRHIRSRAERRPAFDVGHSYQVTARSLLVFVLALDHGQPRSLREGIGPGLDILEPAASVEPD